MLLIFLYIGCKTQNRTRQMPSSDASPVLIKHYNNCEEYYDFVREKWMLDSMGIYSFRGEQPKWEDKNEYNKYIDEPCLGQLDRESVLSIFGEPTYTAPKKDSIFTYVYCMDNDCIEKKENNIHLRFSIAKSGDVRWAFVNHPDYLQMD